MNAYELADKLEWHWDNDCRSPAISKSIDMLRQQADRIKDLEKLLEHSVGADCREMRYIQEIENKDARITELEKQLKELSDEEIWEVIDNCFGVHAFNLDYQIALDEAREDAFDLVKTILKKASEK